MKRAIEWAERMVTEVLPDIPYAQLVFTIPKMLRRQFLFDRKLFGDLCRVAYESTRRFFSKHFPDLKDPVPAMIAVPQSFGNLLNFHPHCHSLVSLGVFDRQGNFHAAPEDLDFSPLEKIFQEKMLKMMLKKKKLDKERFQLLTSWEHSGFHIDSSRRFLEGDRAGLEAVLQYLERPPVSLERLSYKDNGVVHYRGKFNPNLQRDYQLVPGVEFLAMLVPHINLKYEIVIRYYGAISATIRKKWGWIKAAAIPTPPIVSFSEAAEKISDQVSGQPAPSLSFGSVEMNNRQEVESEFIKVRKRNWAHFIAKVYLEDPETCPRCGEKMIPVAAISSPAQDDIIKKILVARGQWDPPWKKTRPPRGPPPQPSSAAPEISSSHWVPDEEYFNRDFPDS